MRNLTRFIFIGAVLILISCTRANKETSKVELVLPTQKSILKPMQVSKKVKGKTLLRTLEIPGFADLSHVVINIQGPGISGTLLCGYNVEKGTNYGPCDFTEFPSVKIEIQSGADRLFQLALAYSSEEQNGMSLNYGDRVVSLTAGQTTQLDIPMRELTSGAQQGHLSGRFLTGPNQGPTGVLEVKIKPEDGRPSLTIMQTEIFSGWFHAFSVSGLKFEYVVNGNMVLFNQPVEKAFFSNLASSTTQVRVLDVSDGFEVYGFFGDPGSVAGKTASATDCTVATHYESCLSSNSSFYGPFRAAGNDGPMLTFSASSMTWDLLPGTENSISDFRILYNPNASPDADPEFKKRFLSSEDLKDCNYFESFPGTQVLAGSVPVSQKIFNYTFQNLPESALLALCPRQGPIAYRSALTYPEFNNHGGGNDSTPYLRLEIWAPGSQPVLTLDQCYPAEFNLYRSLGQNSAENYLPTGTVTISNITSPFSGPQWISFYNDSSCTDPFIGNVTINAQNSSHSNNLFAKGIAAGTGLAISPTIQSTEASETFTSFPQHNTFTVSSPMLAAIGPQKMIATSGALPVKQMCYLVQLSRLSAAGEEIGFGLPALDISFNLSGNYSWFSTYSDCETDTGGSSAGPVTIANDMASVDIYLKRSNGSPGDLPIIFSANDYQSVSHSILGSTNSNTGVRFIMTAIGTHEVGKCNAIKVSHVNNQGDEVPLEGFVDYSLKSDPVLS